MPAVDPPRIPGYTLIRLLGAGNYGSVWEARDHRGFPAALKVIDRSRNDASQLELEALEELTRLHHRHLVRVFTSFDVGTLVVIAMELAHGTLEDRLRYCIEAEKLPGIPPAELLHYLRQVASALDYLHGQGVIHRDVKPANILLLHDTEPYAALGDCGLLRRQRDEGEDATIIGTPAFLAPEVWQQRARSAADRYSLAVTYVELRQGRRPFKGTDAASVRRAHREDAPELSGLEEREQEVVRRALSVDPAQRHGSCQEFVQELEAALGVQPFSLCAARVGLRPRAEKEAAPPRRTPREESPGTHWPKARPSDADDYPPTIPRPPTMPPPTTTRTAPPPRKDAATRWVGVALTGLVGVAVFLGMIWWWPRGGDGKRGDPPAPPAVPAGFQAAEGSRRVVVGGREFFDCLVSDKAGPGVRFWLLPPRDGEKDEPAPFYLLEDKVTNKLYRRFAGERPDEAGASWRKGGRRGGGQDAGGGDDLPALRVTRPQAEAFARWLGGRLPSCAQLDRAAGWREGVAPDGGPFRGDRVAVGRRDQGPAAVGGPEEEGDVCAETKIRGLAGNGREWTRDDVGECAALRGRSYTAPGPLTYGLLREFRSPDRRLTLTQRPAHASPYTGFRVAVEPPGE